MKASELVKMLQYKIEKYGDLPIIGGYMSDDGGLAQVCVIDERGVDCEIGTGEQLTPEGFFFEQGL